MATFITTTEISFQIEQLIKKSSKYFFIVSPFLKIHNRLKKVLEEKISSDSLQLIVICRKKDLTDADCKWASKYGVKMFYHENLHAKCYFNEFNLILTSMNLYEFSAVNNIEYGMIVDKASDGKLYDEIRDESFKLIDKPERDLILKNIDTYLAGETKKLQAKYSIEGMVPA